MGDFGRELSCKRAATLPELSEWTLKTNEKDSIKNPIDGLIWRFTWLYLARAMGFNNNNNNGLMWSPSTEMSHDGWTRFVLSDPDLTQSN